MLEITITQVTALYAALVSTAVAAWSFYRDWNDTGRLKVTVGFRLSVGNGMTEENLLVWSITNVGKRSVMLTHVGGESNPSADDKGFSAFLVTDPQLPKRLEPGDYHMSICREYDFSGGDLKRLYAMDSLGRTFSAPQSHVKEVNRKMKELKARGITKSSIRPPRLN